MSYSVLLTGCSSHVQVMILFFATFLGTIGPLNTWNTIGYQQVASRSNITGSLPGALHASLTPLIDYVCCVLYNVLVYHLFSYYLTCPRVINSSTYS